MTYFTMGSLYFLAFKHHAWTNHRSGVRPRPYKKPEFLKSRLLENQKIFRNSGDFYTKMGFVGFFLDDFEDKGLFYLPMK